VFFRIGAFLTRGHPSSHQYGPGEYCDDGLYWRDGKTGIRYHVHAIENEECEIRGTGRVLPALPAPGCPLGPACTSGRDAQPGRQWQASTPRAWTRSRQPVRVENLRWLCGAADPGLVGFQARPVPVVRGAGQAAGSAGSDGAVRQMT
jgi:hypothetical protein